MPRKPPWVTGDTIFHTAAGDTNFHTAAGDTIVHKAAGDTIVHKALFAGAQAAADNGKKVARRKALPNLRVSYITYITCILFVA